MGVVLLCSLLLGLFGPARGFAHGGGAPQLTDVPAGAYHLFAWTSPDPWQAGAAAHVTVAVTQVDATGQTTPVSTATVQLLLTAAAQPEQTLRLVAAPNATAAGFYEADGVLPVAGAWRVEVQVSGDAGQGASAFTLTATPGSALPGWLWGGGVLGVVALVGILWMRRRKPAAAHTHTVVPQTTAQE